MTFDKKVSGFVLPWLLIIGLSLSLSPFEKPALCRDGRRGHEGSLENGSMFRPVAEVGLKSETEANLKSETVAGLSFEAETKTKLKVESPTKPKNEPVWPAVIHSETISLHESHDRYRRRFRIGPLAFAVEIRPGFEDEWQFPGDYIVTLSGPGGEDNMFLPSTTTRVRNGSGPVRRMSFEGRSVRVSLDKVKFVHHAPSASRLYKKAVFSVTLMSHDPGDRVIIEDYSFPGVEIRPVGFARIKR